MKITELERSLKVLANRRRLTILQLLKKKRSANVGDVASMIHLSFKSTSKHLIMLERAGFVEKDQTNLNVNYRISGDAPHPYSELSKLI